jgi:hypothetical protein
MNNDCLHCVFHVITKKEDRAGCPVSLTLVCGIAGYSLARPYEQHCTFKVCGESLESCSFTDQPPETKLKIGAAWRKSNEEIQRRMHEKYGACE